MPNEENDEKDTMLHDWTDPSCTYLSSTGILCNPQECLESYQAREKKKKKTENPPNKMTL